MFFKNCNLYMTKIRTKTGVFAVFCSFRIKHPFFLRKGLWIWKICSNFAYGKERPKTLFYSARFSVLHLTIRIN